ncbi:MAG TPA: nucleoside-triphosphatase [Bacteroidales bacterium]|nr:nucleoside-triphosphatase [Bacteroidales bacterium]HNS46980.1 nucleoside-triphosphatase [Bacteroidales bacterium]
MIFLITGKKGEGKTSWVMNLARLLAGEHIQVGGICSTGTWKDGERDRFHVRDLENGRTSLLCDRVDEGSDIPYHHFFFKQSGVDFGLEALRKTCHTSPDVLIIDEVGGLELQKGGWATFLETLHDVPAGIILLVVRESLADRVRDHWHLTDAKVVRIADITPERFLHLILQERETADQSRSLIWQKAAIAGGLWASVEIILGSFMHNLRIPFSGSILAFFGVILMVSFSRLWPEKGLIWRAGLICALMKSVSPSAVILGPMTGIFAEAVLLQLFVNIFGRNLAGYMTGGVFSLMSALIHKVITLLIIYGTDLFKIYLNLYYFAARQVRIQQADPWVIILILIFAYVIFGVIAAILGYSIGKRPAGSVPPEELTDEDPGIQQSGPSASSGGYRSIYMLLAHLAAIPVCLYIINMADIYIGLILPFLYCILIVFLYAKHLKRLKKPFFWLQLMIILILSAFFWSNPVTAPSVSKWEGVWVGLQLNFRAILVILGFTAISVELKNPRIQHYLVNHGCKNIYWSLNLAFSILPVMVKNITRGRYFFLHPIASLSTALMKADQWLNTIQNQQRE